MPINSRQSKNLIAGTSYRPSLWKEICAFALASTIVAVTLAMLLTGQEFPNGHSQVVRAILSLAVAVVGATIPGFLNVDVSFRGVGIRAGGALALFVLTFALWKVFDPSPKPWPKASFEIVDFDTGDPILRNDVMVHYDYKGRTQKKEAVLGKVDIDGAPGDSKNIRVDCSAYDPTPAHHMVKSLTGCDGRRGRQSTKNAMES